METFYDRLAVSYVRVNKFASSLYKRGINILLPPVTDTFDDGDLFVTLRVEHKVRSLQFTCREDYPYDTIFIDEVYKIDNKFDLPLCYVIENTDGTCCAVIYGFTKPHWKKETKFDKIQNRVCDFYVVSKSQARFCKPEELFGGNSAI